MSEAVSMVLKMVTVVRMVMGVVKVSCDDDNVNNDDGSGESNGDSDES